mgnify:CR=1 FL=1
MPYIRKEDTNMPNTDITYCQQKHQIGLCKACLRNHRNLQGISIEVDRISYTIFEPTLTPTQSCFGFLAMYPNIKY